MGRTDTEIKTAARRTAPRKRFSRYVRGLKCRVCGSRETRTEFYRVDAIEQPAFGVTGCDRCGAC